jgi:hypothetical protein
LYAHNDEYGLEYGSPASPRIATKAAPISMDEAPPISGLYDVPVTTSSVNYTGYGGIPTRTSATTTAPPLSSPGTYQTSTPNGRHDAWPARYETNGQPSSSLTSQSHSDSLFASPTLSGTSSLLKSTTVRIVGFPPETAHELFDHFYNLAPVASYRAVPGSNWMTLTYGTRAGAELALTLDQAVLVSGSMIAVTIVADPDNQQQSNGLGSKPVTPNISLGVKQLHGGLGQPFQPSPSAFRNSETTKLQNMGGLPDGSPFNKKASERDQVKQNAFMPPTDKTLDFGSSTASKDVPRKVRADDDNTDNVVIRPPSMWSQVLNSVFGW